MNAIDKSSEWLIGPCRLRMEIQGGTGCLVPQTPDRNLLSFLAASGLADVSACALDIVFQWGSRTLDEVDALRAYSLCPSVAVPSNYKQLFSDVDWTKGNPSEASRAIILAGAKGEVEKELLMKILQTLSRDFRDGALYAASSFSEMRFVELVAQIAMADSEGTAFATGEMWAFIHCFQRWIREGLITLESLEALLASHSIPRRDSMTAPRLINYVACPDWRSLPHPEEVKLTATEVSKRAERGRS